MAWVWIRKRKSLVFTYDNFSFYHLLHLPHLLGGKYAYKRIRKRISRIYAKNKKVNSIFLLIIMKILVFTEGTIIMHGLAKGISREERVKQSQAAGIQREERNIAFESNSLISRVPHGSVYDLENYIPISNAVEKLKSWKDQGAIIIYLSSRRIKSEVETIKQILKKYSFPDFENLYFRKQGENYKDIAERLIPDILIEDDCESIGGVKEMVYPHIKEELKSKIKSIVIKEFEGINNLPMDITLFRNN
jgi:hypothetical protein